MFTFLDYYSGNVPLCQTKHIGVLTKMATSRMLFMEQTQCYREGNIGLFYFNVLLLRRNLSHLSASVLSANFKQSTMMWLVRMTSLDLALV